MGLFVGVRHPARQLLRVHCSAAAIGEYGFRIIARLHAHHAAVDGTAIDARRRAGFQAPNRQLQLAQPRGQRHRRRITGSPRLIILQANMNQAGEEGTGGQHHSRRFKA